MWLLSSIRRSYSNARAAFVQCAAIGEELAMLTQHFLRKWKRGSHQLLAFVLRGGRRLGPASRGKKQCHDECPECFHFTRLLEYKTKPARGGPGYGLGQSIKSLNHLGPNSIEIA